MAGSNAPSDMKSRAGVRPALRVMVTAVALGTGCYSHAYHVRAASPDLQRVAIETTPHEETRWSTLWGAPGTNEWSPVICVATDDAGRCTRQMARCDHGLGRVEVSYTAATFVLTILTIGTAVPMHVSAWCATGTAPRHGP